MFLPAGELRPAGGDALATELEGLRSILEVRLLGVARVIRQAKPRMESGSITLMSGSTQRAPQRAERWPPRPSRAWRV